MWTDKKEERSKLNIAIAVLLLIGIFIPSTLGTNSISVSAGHSYYAEIDTKSDTSSWSGIVVQQNAIEAEASSEPFLTMALGEPITMILDFPGYNLDDGTFFYAASTSSRLSIFDVESISESDLSSSGIFRESEFPVFHPNYDTVFDNPRNTYCCDTAIVTLGGVNFTAFKTVTNYNVPIFLLKYINSYGQSAPLFLVKMNDSTCFNSQSCAAQFMVPAQKTYNFFIVGEKPSYNITTYVDGYRTNNIYQTAQTYNLTAEVKNVYSGEIARNIDVLVGEDNGQNIFIPYKLEGFIAKTYSIGRTDNDGKITFLAAPTVYPSSTDYRLYIGVLYEGDLLTTHEMNIINKDQLIRDSKPIPHTALYDNAKTAVNAMNQISYQLFKWANVLVKAQKLVLTYDYGMSSFTVYDQSTGMTNDTIMLKTGAPNVINAQIKYLGSLKSGFVNVEEAGGYMLMNPASNPIPTGDRTHLQYQRIETGEEFIITPTSLGFVQPNITFTFYDSYGNTLYSTQAQINSSLNPSGGVTYNNDLLKTLSNALNQVVYSLYYSLNY